MNRIIQDLLTAMAMGILLPAILLQGAVNYVSAETESAVQEETVPEIPLREGYDPMLFLRDGRSEQMDLETYLVGVVLAEMPASFEPEALKAQAVAARTYTKKASHTGGKHGDGSVCADSSCCQAYITPEDYLLQGGTEQGLAKVTGAVYATEGEVLTYNEELIEATYFSCSGGSTEDAQAVWGTDFPYLRAVDSPGEEAAAHFSDTVTFTPATFQQALGVTLSGSPKSWFGLTAYTKGGGVDILVIGGEEYSGTRLRSLLGLRSTAMTIAANDEEITVTTKGYGHRVGMSQYGADAMAVTGSTYNEILAHYYPGTTLQKWNEPD